MRLGLYVVPGAEVAGQALRRLVEGLGATALSIAPDEAALSPVDGVIVLAAFVPGRRPPPGGEGTNGGDGAEGDVSLPRLSAAVEAFARAGGPVLGIGAGVHLLCALGLLPGRVTLRPRAGAPGRASHLRVEGRPTPFTSAIPAGRVMDLTAAEPIVAGPAAPAVAPAFAVAPSVGPSVAPSVSPASGSLLIRYEVDQPAVLEARGQVIFRYCDASGRACDAAGGATPASAWDRSPHSIAGVCGEGGNVVGLLSDPASVAGDGQPLLRSLSMHLRAPR